MKRSRCRWLVDRLGNGLSRQADLLPGAILAGGVVLNSIQGELSAEQDVRAFGLGVVFLLGALLLAL